MTIQQIEENLPFNNFHDVRNQLERHIYGRSERAFAMGDVRRDAILNRTALARRQQAIRRVFLNCIGGLPSGSSRLNARVVGRVRAGDLTIEKVIYESRPGHFVTANLYLPPDITGPRGAVLFLCGHWGISKQVSQYQTVCQTIARAGLVVLAQDPVGQGERFSYYDPRLKEPGDDPELFFKATTVACGVSEHTHAGLQCQPLGDEIARYFLHDAMRGVDYLQSRPEVDPKRIGVTGNSGGGTQTAMMMMTDPRVAAAAPGTFIMNRRSCQLTGQAQDAEQIWPGFTAAGLDHEDILLAMAPRPVCVLAVSYDFFPIEGTRRTVERCRRIWTLCGKPSNLHLVEDQSLHCYTPRLAHAAARFFAHHLLGREVDERRLNATPLPPSKLWCTQTGQLRGEVKGARFVYDSNQERLAEGERKRARIPTRKRQRLALNWLRKQVFNHRKRCPLNPRFILKDRVDALWAEWAMWWSQEEVHNAGILFKAFENRDRSLPVTLAVWNEGTRAAKAHADWIRARCRNGRAVLVLDVSGSGALIPHPINPGPVEGQFGSLHKFADDLNWLDDNLAALRTFDVIRALDMIAEWPGLLPDDIRVYAHGRQGLYAQLAAVLDPRIRKIEVREGLGSFARFVRTALYDPRDIKFILLRGILRYFDLPDLKKWGIPSRHRASP